MLYPFVPSLRVALKTQVGRDLRGCSHEDTRAHACSPTLQEKAWGSRI